MILLLALVSITCLQHMAIAVIEVKVIQMADHYVLVAIVQALANLVADHVPQDLHVVGFFQMMYAKTLKSMKVIADHVRMFAFREKHAVMDLVKTYYLTMTIAVPVRSNASEFRNVAMAHAQFQALQLIVVVAE